MNTKKHRVDYENPYCDENVMQLMKEGYTYKQIKKSKEQYDKVSEMMVEKDEIEEWRRAKEDLAKTEHNIAEAICARVNEMIDHKAWEFPHYKAQKQFVKPLTGKDHGIVDCVCDMLYERYDHDFQVKNTKEFVKWCIDRSEYYIKYMLNANREQPELFPMNDCVINLGVRALLTLGNFNDSKKKRVHIRETMPDKRCMKYGLIKGQIFESQKALADYCHVSKKQIILWKKSNYIEELD